MFKKLVIADNLALVVDRVYAAPAQFGAWDVTLATYAFAFQIYCDFSGYTDMARGIAGLLGYRLERNFDFPSSPAACATSGDAGTSRCPPGCATTCTSLSAAIVAVMVRTG